MKRVCCKCSQEKDIQEFAKHSKMKDGYDTICKECSRERAKEHYKKNREKKRQYQLNYYKENAEKVRSYQKKYKEENVKKVREYFKEYAQTEYRKAYKAHQSSLRRAKLKDTDITEEYLVLLKTETDYCPLCGVKMNDIHNDPAQYNLDHILPLAAGGFHFKENVRYICRLCNEKRPIDGSDIEE